MDDTCTENKNPGKPMDNIHDIFSFSTEKPMDGIGDIISFFSIPLVRILEETMERAPFPWFYCNRSPIPLKMQYLPWCRVVGNFPSSMEA